MDFQELTARDVMAGDVVTAAPEMAVADLMDLLLAEGLSGVPVVDRSGKVAGVVSSTDVLRAAAEEARTVPEPSDASGPAPFYSELGGAPRAVALGLPANLPRTRLGARPVRDIMTKATLSVRPDATLLEVARFLVRAGVHRALVMEGGSLVGLVSALDVLVPLAESGAR